MKVGEARYHVRFRDEAAKEELGLLLVESPQLGYDRRLVNPYAAKGSTGATKDSDLTEWSVVSQRDWRGGRGQEEYEEAESFLDARNLETRIEGQVTIGPLPQNPSGELPAYGPGSASSYVAGWPPTEKNLKGGAEEPVGLKAGFKVAQRFYLSGSSHVYPVTSVELRLKRDAATSGHIRMAIYSHSTSTGVPGTLLAYKDLTEADVGTEFSWISFELAETLNIMGGLYYWIVLSTESGGHYYWCDFSSDNPYADGYVALFCPIWLGEWRRRPSWDIVFKVHFTKVSYSMSFTAPAGGITCDLVQLLVGSLYSWRVYTVALCADDGGVPGEVLKSNTVGPWSGFNAIYGTSWLEVEWEAGGQALTGGATYHITLEPTTMEALWWQRMVWVGCAGGGYGDGVSHERIGTGGWEAQAQDLYFRVNRRKLDGAPVGFGRYDGKWYCAAGDAVYEWDEAAKAWDVSDEKSGDDVTALEVWGGYLWAARGSAGNVRRYNGTAWANAPGPVEGTLLKAGGGYLHRTGTGSNDHKVYYTVNGTDWTEIEVGSGDYGITGMAWYRDMLVVSNAVRLYGTAADLAYPLLDWSTQEETDNGKGMSVWGKTGCLYIPLRFGLYRYNGDTMVAVGPEQGMGLPAERAGRIVGLVGTGNWLLAAVDAGASGYSSVMCYNGMGGWHELQRCEQEKQRIQALGFETIHSPNRLWFGMSRQTRYLMLPDYTDNPWGWSGYEFNVSGEIELSWMGGELLEVVKDLREVVVRGEGMGADQLADVYYEVDRSGQWMYLGRVTESPRQALAFEASEFAAKVVGEGSTRTTIELAAGSTTEDMAGGDWVRVNGEVAQVASITDDTFVLGMALEAAPESGDVVYGSRPAGREFRLKLVLATTDKTATPKVKAIFVRYQNNVLDRFVYALRVRVEDGLSDLAGNPYPHTAADLRVLLDGWCKRICPFVLYDPDGVGHMVKVTGAGEGGMKRKAVAGGQQYGSVYAVNLVEVG